MLWFVVALLALAVAVSALAAVRLRTASRQLARCREWPCVTGRIIDSSVRAVSIDGAGKQYIPVVRYRYVVGGTHYEGENLTMRGHPQYSMRRSAARQLARYAAGRVVQVHVDPADPSSAVLECRAPVMTVLWTMIVLLWIVILGGISALVLTPGVVGPEPVIRLSPPLAVTRPLVPLSPSTEIHAHTSLRPARLARLRARLRHVGDEQLERVRGRGIA